MSNTGATGLTSTAGETIWFEDLKGFVDPENLARFFPIQKTSLAEQLNAILRFSLYFALILLVAGRGSYVLFIPIAVAGGTYMMYIAGSEDNRGSRDIRGSQDIQEGMSASTASTASNGTTSEPSKKKPEGSALEGRCTRPTKDNPFMNVLITQDANGVVRGPACDIQDPAVAEKAEALFFAPRDSGGGGIGGIGPVPRDVDDIFGRNTSSRQFVTNPATSTPNDQNAFAQWLYGTAPVCKGANRPACQFRT